MATQTTNLGLTKPDAAEGYDIAVFNANADTIDQFAGEMRNALGGAGGGLGDKVDTLLENVAAVKTDTAALVQALATANQNIATLLTQTGGVKTIFSFRVNGAINTSGTNAAVVNIPETINPEKSVLITNVGPTSSNTSAGGVYWTRSGRTLNIYAWQGYIVDCQLIEFY